ncbi:MAG TPA: metallophosphoesterase, partial [Gammaproteobacteria bacterium]|nr:metallophosphoesterase [Gammaproteobacteria bacterium]
MQNNKLFKVVQITDCHLFKDNSCMFDVPTNQTFNQVIEQIKKEELHDTDAIFLTGDLSQDESKESYQRIVDALQDTSKNIYWIP